MVFMSRRRSGFTLIELLVVIAIIAILAAILFPVFARAREKARQNTCLSNVKQLTLGFLMYTGDYDGYYPLGLAGQGGGWNTGPTWRGLIYPYVKNVGIYRCPSQSSAPNSSTALDDIPGSNPLQKFPACYVGNLGDNGICWWPGGAPMGGNWARSDAEIARPAQVILMTEGENSMPFVYWDQGANNVANGNQLWAGHSGQSNYGFCDGHAKSLKPTATNNPMNLWSSDNGGPCTQSMGACLVAVEAKWSGG
jgi:prepilin-type N-terminal cleavage/methylation domain-containing protein/prepilin-type processing-associated H-X9-DG protein